MELNFQPGELSERIRAGVANQISIHSIADNRRVVLSGAFDSDVMDLRARRDSLSRCHKPSRNIHHVRDHDLLSIFRVS